MIYKLGLNWNVQPQGLVPTKGFLEVFIKPKFNIVAK